MDKYCYHLKKKNNLQNCLILRRRNNNLISLNVFLSLNNSYFFNSNTFLIIT